MGIALTFALIFLVVIGGLANFGWRQATNSGCEDRVRAHLDVLKGYFPSIVEVEEVSDGCEERSPVYAVIRVSEGFSTDVRNSSECRLSISEEGRLARCDLEGLEYELLQDGQGSVRVFLPD